jgi:hypothetical protein
MIDSVLNLIFRCPHHRITRPITPVSKAGVPQGDTYVVCLDCGKQFAYDLKHMRIDKPVATQESAGVLHPNMPKPRKSKVKMAALAAAVPVVWLLGSAIKKKRNPKDTKEPGS